ncbi:MAG: hypothetical protein C0596_06050 [Marinilabiliales bacterium]|nr:MAG: hypothetical protein C0596_06050 [Marinilabiliales bacterium]
MVPNLSAGSYNLIVEGDNYEGELDLSIASLAPIANPTQVISGVTDGFNTIISDLQTEASDAGTTLDTETEALVNNLIDEYESIYAQLSESEKEDLAHFIEENGDIFSSSSKIDTKMTQETYQSYNDYLFNQLPKIAFSGASLGLLLTAPDPTFLTKAAAAIAAIYLIKTLKQTGYQLIKMYGENAIAHDSQLSNGKSDFTFGNDDPVTLNIQTTYRSIYNADASSPYSVITSIISFANSFNSWWIKIDGFISSIKSLFGFSNGGLEGKPEEVSEIDSYTTNQIAGASQYASISGISNSNVSYNMSTTTNGITLTFHTDAAEDQTFNFTYTFTEAGYTISKTYSAIVSSDINAEFSGSPTEIESGQSVSFSDQSTGNPTSWSWSFGDGGTSTSQNPSHTYNAEFGGSFTVSLTVCNTDGCDTETKTDYILVDTLQTKTY